LTAHLLGIGKVGLALLALPTGEVRYVAASDRSASVYGAEGLDRAAIAAHKSARRPLAALADAAPLPLDLALSIADADLVVDATPSDLAPDAVAAAVARTRRLLRAGKRIVLAAKTPLLLASEELRAARDRLGIAAVFGGTGSEWLRDLGRFAPGSFTLASAPNATTTELIEAIERGGTLEDGLSAARAAGLVESDPSQDLDGRDAALKLALAARLAFGVDLDPGAIARPPIEALDPRLLRLRRSRGATTRLVGRIDRGGVASLAFEELPTGHPLAIPSRRVAWQFTGADRRSRLHLGDRVGPLGTARALAADLAEFARLALLRREAA
jgi:homoserine dehydrogenase